MPINRYYSRSITRNFHENIEEFLKNKKLIYVDHYMTPVLYQPTLEDYGSLQIVSHIWATGDRYHKLAHRYYKDSRLWWVIAWFNKKPTEAHVKNGDVIQVPFPLERALTIFRV
jgi:nucleoid-associated protein YgaU|tara:strand:- start:767 stop:1108 length:342 start_codon:yes stop_codon:yes gene_type:complete